MRGPAQKLHFLGVCQPSVVCGGRSLGRGDWHDCPWLGPLVFILHWVLSITSGALVTNMSYVWVVSFALLVHRCDFWRDSDLGNWHYLMGNQKLLILLIYFINFFQAIKIIHSFRNKTKINKSKVKVNTLFPLPPKVTSVQSNQLGLDVWLFQTFPHDHIKHTCAHTHAVWGFLKNGKNAYILICWQSLHFSTYGFNSFFLIIFCIHSIDLP